MNRSITTVIDAILREIPGEYEQLVGRIGSIKDSALYTAPEDMHTRWRQLYNVLESNLGNSNEDWVKDIRNILSGRE